MVNFRRDEWRGRQDIYSYRGILLGIALFVRPSISSRNLRRAVAPEAMHLSVQILSKAKKSHNRHPSRIRSTWACIEETRTWTPNFKDKQQTKTEGIRLNHSNNHKQMPDSIPNPYFPGNEPNITIKQNRSTTCQQRKSMFQENAARYPSKKKRR